MKWLLRATQCKAGSVWLLALPILHWLPLQASSFMIQVVKVHVLHRPDKKSKYQKGEMTYSMSHRQSLDRIRIDRSFITCILQDTSLTYFFVWMHIVFLSWMPTSPPSPPIVCIYILLTYSSGNGHFNLDCLQLPFSYTMLWGAAFSCFPKDQCKTISGIYTQEWHS